MPSRFRSRRRRRGGRRRGRFSGRGGYAQLSRRIGGLARYIDTTRHYKDLNVTSTNIDAAGAIFLLNATQRGSGFEQRVGDAETAMSIQFRGTFLTSATAAGPSFVRMILFIDKRPNGTFAIIDDLLDTIGTGEAVNSPLNLEEGNRYRILRDKVVGMTGSDTSARTFKYYKRMKMTVRHNHISNAADISTMETNAVYLLFVSDQTTLANLPTVTFFSRYRFVG